jgi:formate/nitrite transporter FocA (FNT family)
MPETATQVELSEEEIREAEERAMPRGAVVFETIRREGEGELNRTISALTFSAISAGLSMGFSLFTMSVLQANLPDTPWRPLVASVGYTVGFLIAILGRQQLFTENTLTPVLVLLHRFDAETFGSVVRLWAIVIAGNFIGAFAFASLLAVSVAQKRLSRRKRGSCWRVLMSAWPTHGAISRTSSRERPSIVTIRSRLSA